MGFFFQHRDRGDIQHIAVVSLKGADTALAENNVVVAAGADGLLVEMHPKPCEAWCDADQALDPNELKQLMGELAGIARVIGRSI